MSKHILNNIIEASERLGLKYEYIKTNQIIFNSYFRTICEDNGCGRYNKTWNCPPAIGDINYLINECKSYSDALIISYVHKLEDPFDIESMDEGRKYFSNFYTSLINKYKLYEIKDIKMLGCGSCDICLNLPTFKECTYPLIECRFKNLAIPSVESCGIDVCKTINNTNLKYYNGLNTVTFFCFILFNTYSLKINNKEIKARSMDNLLEIIQNDFGYIEANCGGLGKCNKCKVYYNDELVKACETKVSCDGKITLINEVDYGLTTFQKLSSFQNIKKVGYALSIDLGTTTIAYHLMDLTLVQLIDASSEVNKEQSYGSDIITRISACKDGKLEILNKIIKTQILNKINYLKKKYIINEFSKIYVSGNPTMLHILANISPVTIGVYPFTPMFLESKIIHLDNEEVTLLNSISSFIGSDITSGIIATDLLNSCDSILLDLGTNGEIVLNTNGKLYATSTAAGPAFEGAGIECGCGGINGAINSCYYVDGKLIIKTVNDFKPIGICGSGLIDIISILLKEELIDEMGSFKTSKSLLSLRLKDNKFYITDEIYISQKDVGNFQLSKSAIRSGINILMRKANIQKLNKIFICGGFGFYVNLDNAKTIGLIPKEGRVEVCGNTSAKGTIMCLLDDDKMGELKSIAEDVECFNLSESSEFDEEFINNMFF